MGQAAAGQGRDRVHRAVQRVRLLPGPPGSAGRLRPAWAGAIMVFFERWMSRIPLPLTAADRTAGYWRELSMRQVEVSRTIVFGAPRNARAFFEALVADNLDLGRPDNVELIFGRAPRGRTGRPPKTPPVCKTA